RLLRWGSSPGALEALHRMNKEIDVRHVLTAVRVPTLVLHGAEDTIVPLEVAEHIASKIPPAQLVSQPEAGHLAFGTQALAALHETERFLTEAYAGGAWDEAEPD